MRLESEFYCTQCGKKVMSIFRPSNKTREKGHLKKLYCIYCNKENNCAEVSLKTGYTKDLFKLEFYNNNFDLNGNRIKSIKTIEREYYYG